jgi:hypothetical protein
MKAIMEVMKRVRMISRFTTWPPLACRGSYTGYEEMGYLHAYMSISIFVYILAHLQSYSYKYFQKAFNNFYYYVCLYMSMHL